MDRGEPVLLFGTILLSVLIGMAVYFAKQEQCDQKSISFQEHKYGLFSGCMVKHNDMWLPLENIRGFGDD